MTRHFPLHKDNSSFVFREKSITKGVRWEAWGSKSLQANSSNIQSLLPTLLCDYVNPYNKSGFSKQSFAILRIGILFAPGEIIPIRNQPSKNIISFGGYNGSKPFTIFKNWNKICVYNYSLLSFPFLQLLLKPHKFQKGIIKSQNEEETFNGLEVIFVPKGNLHQCIGIFSGFIHFID